MFILQLSSTIFCVVGFNSENMMSSIGPVVTVRLQVYKLVHKETKQLEKVKDVLTDDFAFYS